MKNFYSVTVAVSPLMPTPWNATPWNASDLVTTVVPSATRRSAGTAALAKQGAPPRGEPR